jgi:hypothetical protein
VALDAKDGFARMRPAAAGAVECARSRSERPALWFGFVPWRDGSVP